MANNVIVEYTGLNVEIATLGLGDELKLVPGNNVVPAATWARFSDATKGSASLRGMIKSGQVKFTRALPESAASAGKTEDAPGAGKTENEAGGNADGQAEALTGLKTSEQEEIVVNTFDLALLKLWLERTTSKAVRTAITKQIALVETGE
jgi:hypothetical protein